MLSPWGVEVISKLWYREVIALVDKSENGLKTYRFILFVFPPKIFHYCCLQRAETLISL